MALLYVHLQVRKTTKRGFCPVTIQEGAPRILRADQETCGLQKDKGKVDTMTHQITAEDDE